MQRLHEDDLVGYVLAQEDWEVLSFPAIAEGAPDRYNLGTAMLHPPSGPGFAPRARAAGNPRTYPADARRIQFRRRVSAIAPVGSTPEQGGMVHAFARE